MKKKDHPWGGSLGGAQRARLALKMAREAEEDHCQMLTAWDLDESETRDPDGSEAIGRLAAMERILEGNPGLDLDATGPRFEIAIHEACSRAQTDSVLLILDRGASPSFMDNYGGAPWRLPRRARHAWTPMN